jgi:pimeloyl-ACP methyl ester carboxylesterase
MEIVKSKDGTPIAFDRSGEGLAVILVSGAFIDRTHAFNVELGRILASQFMVINYDRRGRGNSGDTKPYAVEREIEDLEALVGAAGGSACMLGVSSGAVLALKAAARGLAIEKLALFEPPFMLAEADRPSADHALQLNHFIEAGKRAEATSYFMTRVMGMPAIVPLLMRLTPYWSRSVALAHTLPYESAIMGDFSFPEKLAASVRIPTLVVGGSKSPRPLRDAVWTVAGSMPNAEGRLLEGQAHNVSAKVPAPAIEQFFCA